MSKALRPGGRLALSAFSSYFAVKYFGEATFDADLGVNHKRTEVKNEFGDSVAVDLWTGCYTPRELRLLSDRNDLHVDSINSVAPGQYRIAGPTVETPEYLVLATRRQV